MAFYDRHGIGELLSTLTNDIAAYREVLGPGILYPLFFLTITGPGLLALASISPILAVISLVPLLLIPALNALMRHKVYKASYAAQKGLADLSNMAQEHYSGIRIVKGYVAERSLGKRFDVLSRSLIDLNFKLGCYQGLLFPFFTLLTKLVTVTLVLFSGLIILKAWATLSIADFISFMWIQSYIFFPVLMLAWVLPLYERGRSAYNRLLEVYNEPVEVQDVARDPLEIPANAGISFSHLSFKYPLSDRLVLQDFSLSIKGGSFVGITGPVGAGKTTLFRLLNREYEVGQGKIMVDGRDIHDYPLDAFRNQIVTVEQIPFLFSRSIADNVRFGREEASLQEIEIVSQYADLHDTVLGFPEQYDTMIGERGLTLSGGQRQRVAMARAFLLNRSILLLDDIFSAVDTQTQRRIFASMQANFAGKTVLLITHRISILEAMDRVLYMSGGKIIEDGSPQQLLEKNGYYAALAALQGVERPPYE
jgi:ATP-binding cassette subfamily B protein